MIIALVFLFRWITVFVTFKGCGTDVWAYFAVVDIIYVLFVV